jgi:hypothetical protein
MKRALPRSLTPVFTRRQALASGLSRHEIEWALRSGQWLTLRRGAYCLRETYDASDPVSRHLLHCQAAVLTHDDRHVLSHLSAALSYDLPTPLRELGRPTLTIGGAPASTDRQPDLVVQVAGLRERDTTSWHGHRRTSPTRTVVDCLRHLPAVESVPIADQALRRGLLGSDALEAVLRWQEGWPSGPTFRQWLRMSWRRLGSRPPGGSWSARNNERTPCAIWGWR